MRLKIRPISLGVFVVSINVMIAHDLRQIFLGTYCYLPSVIEHKESVILTYIFILKQKNSTNGLFKIKLLLYKKIKVFGDELMTCYCYLSFTCAVNIVFTSLLIFHCSVVQHEMGNTYGTMQEEVVSLL